MLEQVKSHMLALREIVSRLPLGADGEKTKQLETYLNQMLLNMALFENAGHSDEEKRKAIVSMRVQIHQMFVKLDDLQTWMAEEYRKLVGDSDAKEAFEKLSDEQQMQSNPEAFESRSTFHALVKMSDLLSLLQGLLMDRGNDLEKSMQASKSPADTTPTETYDRDPAPSPLTP